MLGGPILQPALRIPVMPNIIQPWSDCALGPSLFGMVVINPSSAQWVAANVAIFVPFYVTEPVILTKAWWANGGTVAGNVDVGCYDESGALKVSTGSTAVAGTSVQQSVDITDALLGRGRYYMAMVSDTGGATQLFMRATPAAGILQALGCLEQAGVTLPLATNASPATFAIMTRAFLPVFGFQATRVVGP